MAQCEKRVGIALLLAGLIAGPAPAQYKDGGTAGLTSGIRTGVLYGSTELIDESNAQVLVFWRYGLVPKWQGELEIGYGRLSGRDYGTDMVLAGAKLLFSPIAYKRAYPYLYGGVGVVDYDVDKVPNIQEIKPKAFDRSTTFSGGLGFQFRAIKNVAIEVSTGYSYVLDDKLNGMDMYSGNDSFWSYMVGLKTVEYPKIRRIEPVPMPEVVREEPVEEVAILEVVPEEPEEEVVVPEWQPPPEEPSPEPSIEDQDGDGLDDGDERRVYFTNPVMADSDYDGLSDGDEVQVYETDPNQADTDGGGVGDGDEITRGTNPLDSEDDPLRPPQLIFPSLFFGSGRTSLEADVEKLLDEVAGILKENLQVELELRGYADSVGNAEDNLRLARRRAEAVKDYLVHREIDAGRLRVKAFGERESITPSTMPAGRRQSRRVDLVRLQKK